MSAPIYAGARSVRETMGARAACDFRKPITYPETVAVTMRAARVGSSSFTVAHDIRSERDAEVLYATGEVVVVWINYGTGKAVPLPKLLRAALAVPV